MDEGEELEGFDPHPDLSAALGQGTSGVGNKRYFIGLKSILFIKNFYPLMQERCRDTAHPGPRKSTARSCSSP